MVTQAAQERLATIPREFDVRPPKIAAVIAALLRTRIVRGELRPGQMLPSEAVLATQFGVSRPTLREALRVLESESLVMLRRGAGGGAEVSAPDPAVAARHVAFLLQMAGTTLADVYEACAVIEPAAASLLAARRTRQDLAELEAAIDAADRRLDDSPLEPHAIAAAMRHVHDVVLERAGNGTLQIQAGLLREVVGMHLTTVMSEIHNYPTMPATSRKATRSFRRLLLMIDARDGRAAQAHWRAHILAVGRVLVAITPRADAVLDVFS